MHDQYDRLKSQQNVICRCRNLVGTIVVCRSNALQYNNVVYNNNNKTKKKKKKTSNIYQQKNLNLTVTLNRNPNHRFYQLKLENYDINVTPDKNSSRYFCHILW